MNLLLILYIVGALIAFPRIFRYVLRDLAFPSSLDKEDVLFAGLAAIGIAPWWPVIVVIKLIDIFAFTPFTDWLNSQYEKGRFQ